MSFFAFAQRQETQIRNPFESIQKGADSHDKSNQTIEKDQVKQVSSYEQDILSKLHDLDENISEYHTWLDQQFQQISEIKARYLSLRTELSAYFDTSPNDEKLL